MATLDTNDPKILQTYETIRAGDSGTDWMILSVLPKLPGQNLQVLSVLASGAGGIQEFQKEFGQGEVPLYGYVKHENKFYLVECVPEQTTNRALAFTYGKQINALLKEHDSEISITSPSDLLETPLTPTRVPLHSSSSSNILPGKALNQSTSSLSSDKGEDAQEEVARRVREHTAWKEQLKEEAARKVKAAAEERVKEQQWLKEKTAKERSIKESYKAQYQTMEDKNRKGAILSNWLDQLTSDNRYWRKRWMVIHHTHLHLYKDQNSTKPIQIIDLRNSAVTDSGQEWYLPNTFTVREGSAEHVLRAEGREDFLRAVAAVERAASKL
ncbi:hypothetical protein SpCBS45565_g05390 [Spizellomyces sp. 'palustris']|nr:hypothetical protein SpCBS45565_g05390 [Spizellomyces sp. 'palustris']